MGRQVALLIAIERYHDGRFTAVRHAEADARSLAVVLEQHGFETELLIDDDATKARVDSHLRRMAGTLNADDVLYVYYAGHGFAESGENLLTCYDTVWPDKARTSLPLRDVLHFLEGSGAKRVAMFVDACHSGLSTGDDRGLVEDMDEEELTAFFDKSEFCVCFSSCKTEEKSYPSSALGHGIWTYCLVEALAGRAPEAIFREGRITSSSLQNYFRRQVPLLLRQASADIRRQTPMLYGKVSSDFLVADVAPMLEAARRTKLTPLSRSLRQVALVDSESAQVKRLSGFKKGSHSVPREVSDYTNQWVQSLAKQELKNEIRTAQEQLRSLGYKRTDMRFDMAVGSGTIVTSGLTFNVTVALSRADDPSTVEWRRSLENITDERLILDRRLDSAFGACFDRIELVFNEPVAVSDIIDRIEQAESDDITVEDYAPDASECVLTLKGLDYEVKVTPDTLTLESASDRVASELYQALTEARRLLIAGHRLELE